MFLNLLDILAMQCLINKFNRIQKLRNDLKTKVITIKEELEKSYTIKVMAGIQILEIQYTYQSYRGPNANDRTT